MKLINIGLFVVFIFMWFIDFKSYSLQKKEIEKKVLTWDEAKNIVNEREPNMEYYWEEEIIYIEKKSLIPLIYNKEIISREKNYYEKPLE